MDEKKLEEAVANPSNQGEMADADAVGTVGNPDCGDMVRMWVKFREGEEGEKVIDRATFQSFGCQTALAVASVATEMIAGRTVTEALAMNAGDLSKPLGALPPMKIHCGQMVEGALRDALSADTLPSPASEEGEKEVRKDSLSDSFSSPAFPAGGQIRIVPVEDSQES